MARVTGKPDGQTNRQRDRHCASDPFFRRGVITNALTFSWLKHVCTQYSDLNPNAHWKYHLRVKNDYRLMLSVIVLKTAALEHSPPLTDDVIKTEVDVNNFAVFVGEVNTVNNAAEIQQTDTHFVLV